MVVELLKKTYTAWTMMGTAGLTMFFFVWFGWVVLEFALGPILRCGVGARFSFHALPKAGGLGALACGGRGLPATFA